jgi:LysM repeat protein
LISANPRFSPNTLAIGDVITIPNCKSGKPITATPTLAPVVQGGAATVTKSVVGDVPRTYIIVAGDTLGKIASQFGVTVDELVKANNFANDRVILKIGQLIVIPNKQ